MSTKTYTEGCEAKAVCNLPTGDQSAEWLEISATVGAFLPYDAGRAGSADTYYAATGGAPWIVITIDGANMKRCIIQNQNPPGAFFWDSGAINEPVVIDEPGSQSTYVISMQGSSGTENDFEVTLTLANVTNPNPVRYQPPVKSLTLGKMPPSMAKFLEFAQGWIEATGSAGAAIASALATLRALVALAKSPSGRTRPNIVAMDEQRKVVENEIRQVAAKQQGRKPVGAVAQVGIGNITIVSTNPGTMQGRCSNRPKGGGKKWYEIQIVDDPNDEDGQGEEFEVTRSPWRISTAGIAWNPIFIRGRWVVLQNGETTRGPYSAWKKISLPEIVEEEE